MDVHRQVTVEVVEEGLRVLLNIPPTTGPGNGGALLLRAISSQGFAHSRLTWRMFSADLIDGPIGQGQAGLSLLAGTRCFPLWPAVGVHHGCCPPCGQQAMLVRCGRLRSGSTRKTRWDVGLSMKVLSGILLAVAVVMTVAACSGSDAGDLGGDVGVERVTDERVTDEVVREAAADGLVINGCAIRPATQCPGVDMSGYSGLGLFNASLVGANLQAANMTGLGLSGVNFQAANVSQAKLFGANLSGTDFSYANLSGADLRGANLSWATFTGANLSGANLGMAVTRSTTFSGAIFSGTTMPDGSVRNS